MGREYFEQYKRFSIASIPFIQYLGRYHTYIVRYEVGWLENPEEGLCMQESCVMRQASYRGSYEIHNICIGINRVRRYLDIRSMYPPLSILPSLYCSLCTIRSLQCHPYLWCMPCVMHGITDGILETSRPKVTDPGTQTICYDCEIKNTFPYSAHK